MPDTIIDFWEKNNVQNGTDILVVSILLQIITIFYFKSDNAKFYFGHFDWRNRKKKILRK